MTYLIVLLFVIACMVALDARWKLFVFDKPIAALAVLVLGTAFFLIWDVAAIAAGIFLHRESALMTGIMVGDQLPLEEVFFLFFLCYQTMILFTGTQKLLLKRKTLAVTGEKK